MTAQKNESSNRESSDLELTREELDQASGGSLNEIGAAAAMIAQAQAAGVIRIHGR